MGGVKQERVGVTDESGHLGEGAGWLRLAGSSGLLSKI